VSCEDVDLEEDGMAYKGNDPTLEKVAPDEPVFTLRAQDKLAPTSVRMWADMVDLFRGGPSEKTIEARRCAMEMERWQVGHATKVPD
jgi:hypothetical protein